MDMVARCPVLVKQIIPSFRGKYEIQHYLGVCDNWN